MALIENARDLALDSEGDLLIEAGDFVLTTGVPAIVQAVNQALSLFLGEWFLDQGLGVPWIEEILVKNPDLNAIQSLFRSKIESVPGILAVTFLQLDFVAATRALRVSWRATSDVGEIEGSL